MEQRVCPFCGAPVEGAACKSCGRDPTASRRICAACKNMTPTAEPACCHCGARAASELAWKIPVIVALFMAALILTILLNMSK
jgi:predicted amidophosphoribosyltransferase